MVLSRIRQLQKSLFLALLCCAFITACEKAPSVSADRSNSTIEQRYGLEGAYTAEVDTGNGSLDATILPVTLSDGRVAQLIIPRKSSDGHQIYLKDGGDIYPVSVDKGNLTREQFVKSQPRIVKRAVTSAAASTEPAKRKRSTKQEALIIGGSSGAGAAIGALAGGGKGAAIGAISGGVAGLIYDLSTRNK